MAATNIEKFLAVLVTQFQDLENCLIQLLTYRSIDTATGNQLDIIGKIVGQVRGGLSDDDYRRYCRARIATNKSSGRVNELVNISYLIIYDSTATTIITQEGTATARLRIDGIPVTDSLGNILFKFIFDAKAAGVRIVVQWAQSAPANVFQFDDGPGFNQGAFASSLG